MRKRLFHIVLILRAGGIAKNSVFIGFEVLNICGYEEYGLLGCNAV
jgi:hypothetical protein